MFNILAPLVKHVRVVASNSDNGLSDKAINNAIDEIVADEHYVERLQYISDTNGRLTTCIIEYTV